jgi:hypothetical protein
MLTPAMLERAWRGAACSSFARVSSMTKPKADARAARRYWRRFQTGKLVKRSNHQFLHRTSTLVTVCGARSGGQAPETRKLEAIQVRFNGSAPGQVFYELPEDLHTVSL